MKQDRFLIGILVAIALLVALSLALFFVRKDTQAYLPDAAPEGVVHNYILALHQRDYERAYGYLADEENKPAYEPFRQAFLNHELDVSDTGVRIGSIDASSEKEILVDLAVIHSPREPFSEGWSTTETALLIRQDGNWRLLQMPYPYWGWNWYQPPAGP